MSYILITSITTTVLSHYFLFTRERSSVINRVTPLMITKSIIFPSVSRNIAESPKIPVRKYTIRRI